MSDNVKAITAATLNRAKANPDTCDCYDAVLRLTGKLKRLQAVNLFEVPETEAKRILVARDFYQSLIRLLVSQLQNTFAMEDEIKRKERSIGYLFSRVKILELTNAIMEGYLVDSVETELFLHQQLERVLGKQLEDEGN